MSTNLKEASTAFTARFEKGLTHAEQQLYTKIATVVPSTAASTGYGFLGQIPKIREWLGDRVLHQLGDFEYEIKNKLFEATIEVKRTEFEDNDYGKYGLLFEDFGRESDEFPNDYVFDLLANGHQNICLDGKKFFADDHPVGLSGENDEAPVSNKYIEDDPELAVAPWFLLDTSRVIQPLIWQERIKPKMTAMVNDEDYETFMRDRYQFGIRARGNAGYGFWQLAAMSDKDLTDTSFNEVFTGMSSLKGDSGRPLRIKPNLLIVPPSLRQKAHEVIKRQRLENGESNINFEAVEVMVCPYL